jgi:diamine N-acetyltransferase
MTIRKAETADIPAIARLYWESDNFHFRHESWIYRETTESHRSEEYLSGCIDQADGLFIVADDEGPVAGFAYGYEESRGHFPFHRQRTFFCLENIVVEEGLRGRGIGRELLKAVIAHARLRGYSDVTLNVYSFNVGAIRLYEEFGFGELARDMILKL